METKDKYSKSFNKINLRKISVLNNSFLWKRGHIHLQDFEHSKCVEKVKIYLENYKNAPLILYFKEDDNLLFNFLTENEKWNVGHPDQGIIWKSKKGAIVSKDEKDDFVQINLNSPLIIEFIIKTYFNKEWKPIENSKSSFIVENALTLLEEIQKNEKIAINIKH